MSEEIEENVRAHETYLGGLFYGREEARAEAEAYNIPISMDI